MKRANVDRRPFTGIAYSPYNQFATTSKMEKGPNATVRSDTLRTYPSPMVTVEPTAPHPAYRPLTLAQLKATR
jgi:hypothetical protein